jgi:hypothetical protein
MIVVVAAWSESTIAVRCVSTSRRVVDCAYGRSGSIDSDGEIVRLLFDLGALLLLVRFFQSRRT